ncbi:hypothetical protein DFP74_1835 [Nocardiopsis sp. Huas11]|nr:hypothetical protein DFP74_1835 [Nocardiopsis sp. Huas11]
MNGTDPMAELRALERSALDVTADHARLAARVERFLSVQEARLLKERSGPSRMFVVRAGDLVPTALRRRGLAALDRRDHAAAEVLLADAAEARSRTTDRLRRLLPTVPSLQWEVDAGERLLWTIRWEIGKAQSGRGDWARARETLAEVLDHVGLDGRFKPVRRDLDAVDAQILKETLRGRGKTVRAALQGARPKSRRALRPGLTPEGATTLGRRPTRRGAR